MMARPRYFKKNDSVAITFQLEKDNALILTQMAKDEGENISYIIRKIIKDYLESNSPHYRPSR